mgnify:CR=1 FL=1
MALLDSVKSEFLQEPRNSKYDWLTVSFGVLAVGLSIAGVVVDRFLILGSAFVLMGGAELLSVDQRRLSALLRVGAVGTFVAYGLAVVLAF